MIVENHCKTITPHFTYVTYIAGEARKFKNKSTKEKENAENVWKKEILLNIPFINI